MSRFHTTDFDFLPERAFRHRGGKGTSMTLEGGKGGGDTPAPDPRLVEANIKSLGIQDKAIQGILDNGAEMAPLQREQLQLGLTAARKAMAESGEDREWALQRRGELVRAQKPMLDEAANYNEGERRGILMGEANADIASAFDNARGGEARALTRMGVNPADGRYRSFANQSRTAEALARVSAGRKVSEAARAEGMQLRGNAVNMLSGYPAMASGLTGAGAGYGTAGLGLANSALSGMNSGYGGASDAAYRMGANATGMYSTQNDAYTKSRIAAENNSSSMLGAGVGGIATVAAAFI